MKIVICGSISAAEEILIIKKKLELKGFEVEIPEGVKRESLKKNTNGENVEKARDKIKYDLIRGYYKKIKSSDVVLVVNPKLRNVENYIGGNTFLEMGFAHVLNKRIYILYGLPKISYISEIMAMKPIVINGDLAKLSSYG